jgi:hypothetical protein
MARRAPPTRDGGAAAGDPAAYRVVGEEQLLGDLWHGARRGQRDAQEQQGSHAAPHVFHHQSRLRGAGAIRPGRASTVERRVRSRRNRGSEVTRRSFVGLMLANGSSGRYRKRHCVERTHRRRPSDIYTPTQPARGSSAMIDLIYIQAQRITHSAARLRHRNARQRDPPAAARQLA